MIDHFPVTVPYSTSPTMAANNGPLYLPVDSLDWMTSKLQELDYWGADLYGSRRPDLVARAASVLGLQSRDEFGRAREITDIVELALNFREDIAIMHRGRLEAICFCYPSLWIPGQRVGWTLEEIHGPVADGDLLRKMSQRITEVLATKSMRRYIWTLSTTGALSNHPKMSKPQVTENTTIRDLYFRMETQTTLPLGDGESSIFFVRVDTCPLQELWQDEHKRQTIVKSVDSMTDNVLQYKELVEIKKVLNKNIAV